MSPHAIDVFLKGIRSGMKRRRLLVVCSSVIVIMLCMSCSVGGCGGRISAVYTTTASMPPPDVDILQTDRGDDDLRHYKVLSAEEFSDGAPMGRSTKRSWPPTSIMPVEEVRKYFKDTLLIIMMSPPRYHLVNEVKKHYAQYFQHIFFCGPKNNSDFGVDIRGYDILGGFEQSRAVSRILRRHYMHTRERSTNGKLAGMLKSTSSGAGSDGEHKKLHLGSGNASFHNHHNTPGKAALSGMLFVSDDVIVQPWALAARGLNLRIPWASQMGIANTVVASTVDKLPGMSVLRKYRQKWLYWTWYRHKMLAALRELGDPFKYRLARAAVVTHPTIYKLSKYKRRHVTKEQDAQDEKLWNRTQPYIHNYRYLQWVAFYTIVDSYYVPRSMWADYCDISDQTARFEIGGEIAIASTLKMLHPATEEMNIQYYWSTDSASDCHRFKWDISTTDGFHRCRHDHQFVQYIFSNDTTREAIMANKNGNKKYALNIKDLVEVPHEPMQDVVPRAHV